MRYRSSELHHGSGSPAASHPKTSPGWGPRPCPPPHMAAARGPRGGLELLSVAPGAGVGVGRAGGPGGRGGGGGAGGGGSCQMAFPGSQPLYRASGAFVYDCGKF